MSQICSNCRNRGANPGYSWCQTCFLNWNQQTQNVCTKCRVRAPNPGRSWCQQCYLDSQRPVQGQYLCNLRDPVNLKRTVCNNVAWFDPTKGACAPGCCKLHSIQAQRQGFRTAR
jgi:hypothetical protein